MPVYQYDCTACGLVELVRPMAERGAAADCPDCGDSLTRTIASAPRLGASDRGSIRAHSRNEVARHRPTLASAREPAAGDAGRDSGAHPAGCGCCGPGGGKPRRGTTRVAPDGSKSFPAKRPWMIAH